ncbi:GNAT family N-acetyltransferase [Amycolatopsis sp. NBC_01286]|uniref:GNAT family N-acetyltransferase n=1 Tax=Amycolatopsis sp. NBC_01286 TaxID=2903560 RepID=UPI002E12390A|nr:GNAT family N-acetyltransferase [Amycolatopsis sp. NBC_01286]
MPELITPTADRRTAWLDAHAEWGPGRHEDGFGLLPADEVATPAGFAAWLTRLATDESTEYWWIVDGERVLGGIALRRRDAGAGHIGYGVRPSARRRGLAGWALARVLDEARARGMPEVVLVCEPGNVASAKTIERHGGVRDDGSWRYRVTLVSVEKL